MAERMGATTKSIAGSHTAFIAQPVAGGRLYRRRHRCGVHRMSLAITYRRSGDPAEVLEANSILGNTPPPGLGQLQVQNHRVPDPSW